MPREPHRGVVSISSFSFFPPELWLCLFRSFLIHTPPTARSRRAGLLGAKESLLKMDHSESQSSTSAASNLKCLARFPIKIYNEKPALRALLRSVLAPETFSDRRPQRLNPHRRRVAVKCPPSQEY